MKHKPMLKAVPRRSRYKSSRTETSSSNLQSEQIISQKQIMQNPSNHFCMATVFSVVFTCKDTHYFCLPKDLIISVVIL